MFNKFKYNIVKNWLLSSEIEIINKPNGYRNIKITNTKNNTVIVVHPLEEKGNPDAEKGYENSIPLLRHLEWEKNYNDRYYEKQGPGSWMCDRAGPVTIEDCKTCHGTGNCNYGKEKKMKQKFMDLFIQGKVKAEEIDDYIDIWHDEVTDIPFLHEFLGMTATEYANWVENIVTIQDIAVQRVLNELDKEI